MVEENLLRETVLEQILSLRKPIKKGHVEVIERDVVRLELKLENQQQIDDQNKAAEISIKSLFSYGLTNLGFIASNYGNVERPINPKVFKWYQLPNEARELTSEEIKRKVNEFDVEAVKGVLPHYVSFYPSTYFNRIDLSVTYGVFCLQREKIDINVNSREENGVIVIDQNIRKRSELVVRPEGIVQEKLEEVLNLFNQYKSFVFIDSDRKIADQCGRGFEGYNPLSVVELPYHKVRRFIDERAIS